MVTYELEAYKYIITRTFSYITKLKITFMVNHKMLHYIHDLNSQHMTQSN